MHAHFEGRLTTRDAKRHIMHRFELPPDAGTLEITFRFAPIRVQTYTNLLTLTLFDARGETPAGFRGAGHRGADSGARGSAGIHRVRLTATEATPGYIPGPLPAGEWTIEIDTHMIMPGPPVVYTLDVTATGQAQVAQTAAEIPVPSRLPTGGPGWYRGDLHTHTVHSDAHEYTVSDLARTAEKVGLDFVFLTDHNTTAGLRETAAPFPILFGSGLELTTYWGHALCLGTREWVDWRVAPGSGGMSRISAELMAAGGVFVIAHPGSVGDPSCTGCAWRFGDMMPDGAGYVEVWNGLWAGDSGNEAALALWYDWLNQGYRLTATAGTDTHGTDPNTLDGREGLPGFTVIYAGACREPALLDGLRKGHCYLSAGPRLSFVARGPEGATWQMGECATDAPTLTLAWNDVPKGSQGRLLANGRLLDAWPCADEGRRVWPLPPRSADWLVVEIRDDRGHMLALTNPIYVDAGDPTNDTMGDRLRPAARARASAVPSP